MDRKVRARIHVPEGTEVRKQDYETAAWWTQLKLQPGTYDLTEDSRPGLRYMLWGSIPGEVIDAHFPSGFGGMYYANPDGDKRNVGRTENYTIFRYQHELKDETLRSGIRIEVI